MDELPSGTIGWVAARGTVGFGVGTNPKGSLFYFFFPFCKILSLVAFLRVRLSVRLSRLHHSVLRGCPSRWYELGTTLCNASSSVKQVRSTTK